MWGQCVRYLIWGALFLILFNRGKAAFRERYCVFNYRSGDSDRHTIMEKLPLVVTIYGGIKRLGGQIMGKKLKILKTMPLRTKIIYGFLWVLFFGGIVMTFVGLHDTYGLF